MSRKRQKINNTEQMMDEEDYFRYDELAQMEAEAIRHNITGSDTEVLEYRELDEVPRELISNVEIGEKENQSPDQTDNQEVVQRFRIYSDVETDAFLKENKNKNTGQKTKSDMKIVTDILNTVQCSACYCNTESNTCVSQKSNVTSNKIKSEKEENPFSMFHGAIINGGTINVHIVTGSTNKRKKHV
jgi:hypothetical protein